MYRCVAALPSVSVHAHLLVAGLSQWCQLYIDRLSGRGRDLAQRRMVDDHRADREQLADHHRSSNRLIMLCIPCSGQTSTGYTVDSSEPKPMPRWGVNTSPYATPSGAATNRRTFQRSNARRTAACSKGIRGHCRSHFYARSSPERWRELQRSLSRGCR